MTLFKSQCVIVFVTNNRILIDIFEYGGEVPDKFSFHVGLLSQKTKHNASHILQALQIIFITT